MSETKFTKGEWAVNKVLPNLIEAGHETIAEVNSDTRDEGKANAKLIAAAPDLFNALKDGLDDMKEWRDYLTNQIESFEDREKLMVIDNRNDVIERIRKATAAIKKATA